MITLSFSPLAENMLCDADKKCVIDYIQSRDYNKVNQLFTIRNILLSYDTNINTLEVFVNENGLIFIFDIDYVIEKITL